MVVTLPTAGAAPIEALVLNMKYLMALWGLLVVLQGTLTAVFATMAVYSIQKDEWFTAGLCFLVTALVLAPPKHDPAVLWKIRQEGWRS